MGAPRTNEDPSGSVAVEAAAAALERLDVERMLHVARARSDRFAEAVRREQRTAVSAEEDRAGLLATLSLLVSTLDADAEGRTVVGSLPPEVAVVLRLEIASRELAALPPAPARVTARVRADVARLARFVADHMPEVGSEAARALARASLLLALDTEDTDPEGAPAILRGLQGLALRDAEAAFEPLFPELVALVDLSPRRRDASRGSPFRVASRASDDPGETDGPLFAWLDRMQARAKYDAFVAEVDAALARPAAEGRAAAMVGVRALDAFALAQATGTCAGELRVGLAILDAAARQPEGSDEESAARTRAMRAALDALAGVLERHGVASADTDELIFAAVPWLRAPTDVTPDGFALAAQAVRAGRVLLPRRDEILASIAAWSRAAPLVEHHSRAAKEAEAAISSWDRIAVWSETPAEEAARTHAAAAAQASDQVTGAAPRLRAAFDSARTKDPLLALLLSIEHAAPRARVARTVRFQSIDDVARAALDAGRKLFGGLSTGADEVVRYLWTRT